MMAEGDVTIIAENAYGLVLSYVTGRYVETTMTNTGQYRLELHSELIASWHCVNNYNDRRQAGMALFNELTLKQVVADMEGKRSLIPQEGAWWPGMEAIAVPSFGDTRTPYVLTDRSTHSRAGASVVASTGASVVAPAPRIEPAAQVLMTKEHSEEELDSLRRELSSSWGTVRIPEHLLKRAEHARAQAAAKQKNAEGDDRTVPVNPDRDWLVPPPDLRGM